MKKALLFLSIIVSMSVSAQKSMKVMGTFERSLLEVSCDTIDFPVIWVQDYYKFQHLAVHCPQPMEDNAKVVMWNPTNKRFAFLDQSGNAGKFLTTDGNEVYWSSAKVNPVFSAPTFLEATTATRLSTTRDAYSSFSFDGSTTITTSGGQGITAVLTYADNEAMTTNPVIVDSNGFLSIGIDGLSQVHTITVKGFIPAGKYRQVTFITTKTGTAALPAAPASIKSSQEVLQ